MGIYDREYYRGANSRLLDPWRSTGEICKWLILVNVGVFVLQLVTLSRAGGMGWVADPFGPVTNFLELNTDLVMSGQVWRLLTYAFAHDPSSIWHIVFNMLFLWWFGSELERMYGPREFLTFYLVAGVVGGIAFTGYFGLAGEFAHCIGASGAVTAVMVVYACHFPFRTILLFFFLPVPIWLFVAFYVLQDLFVFVSGARTGTAVSVHLAGALFGFLYFRLQWRISPLWSNLNWKLRRPRSRPRLRVYHEQEAFTEATPSAARAVVDEHLEAKLDAVLEKIKSHGKDSLTESERQLLLRASEVYRKRREEV